MPEDRVVPSEPPPGPSRSGAPSRPAVHGDRVSASQTSPVSRQQDDWWRTGVVYQIYPRSFADTNADGIGDLRGVIEHLDHLNDGTAGSLGVDAIWLSPIYPSPDFDFGYDVADYTGIDPRYGSIEDFDRLVEACHARGIRVILDLVLNHSSHRHPWFEASRSSRDGPYADWYIWQDSPGRSITSRRRAPNNWRSYFGGSAWTWDESRGQYYMHTFLPEQPDLNWRHPDVRKALLDVVRTWLDRGVDGFRLDVFNVFFKDAELRSNPRRLGGRGGWSWQRHLRDRNQPELAELLAEMRAIVDERPGRMTVGELFDGSIENAVGYSAPHHLIFDWALLGPPWNARAFGQSIADREAVFGLERWPANVLSNHDQPRHASRLDVEGGSGPGGEGDARAKVAAAMLLTLRGTAFLYYGEEIAQRNLVVPNAQAFDPPARRNSFLFRWWNRDQARGPIAWRPGPGGGFSGGRPWLALTPDHEERNVARQDGDPDSVLSFYRRLVWLRRSTPALQQGAQELLDTGEPDVLAYVRRLEGADALVLLNFAPRPVRVKVVLPEHGRSWRVAVSTHVRAAGEAIGPMVDVRPLEALVAVEA
jgi:alpha-glucosidase